MSSSRNCLRAGVQVNCRAEETMEVFRVVRVVPSKAQRYEAIVSITVGLGLVESANRFQSSSEADVPDSSSRPRRQSHCKPSTVLQTMDANESSRRISMTRVRSLRICALVSLALVSIGLCGLGSYLLFRDTQHAAPHKAGTRALKRTDLVPDLGSVSDEQGWPAQVDIKGGVSSNASKNGSMDILEEEEVDRIPQKNDGDDRHSISEDSVKSFQTQRKSTSLAQDTILVFARCLSDDLVTSTSSVVPRPTTSSCTATLVLSDDEDSFCLSAHHLACAVSNGGISGAVGRIVVLRAVGVVAILTVEPQQDTVLQNLTQNLGALAEAVHFDISSEEVSNGGSAGKQAVAEHQHPYHPSVNGGMPTAKMPTSLIAKREDGGELVLSSTPTGPGVAPKTPSLRAQGPRLRDAHYVVNDAISPHPDHPTSKGTNLGGPPQNPPHDLPLPSSSTTITQGNQILEAITTTTTTNDPTNANHVTGFPQRHDDYDRRVGENPNATYFSAANPYVPTSAQGPLETVEASAAWDAIVDASKNSPAGLRMDQVLVGIADDGVWPQHPAFRARGGLSIVQCGGDVLDCMGYDKMY